MVHGGLYGDSHSGSTRTILDAAVGNMEAAYTYASDRPSDEIFSGNCILPTMTLQSGVYEFTSDVTVPVRGEIAFDGDDVADAFWIMQIAGDLIISEYASVVLLGGAKT